MAKSLFKRLRKPQPRPEFRRKKQTGALSAPLVIEVGDGRAGDDARLTQLARLLGSLTAAKQVLAIQASTPKATLLECTIEWWLRKSGYEYMTQVPMLGGRTVRGGTVVDAVAWLDRNHAVAIMGQGNYWHEDTDSVMGDASIKIRLLGATANGVRIMSVVEVWESALYRNVDRVMSAAVNGREVGK